MQKAMKGEKDDVKLEFYVTAEFYKAKREDSNNVDVANPLKSQGTTTPAKKTAIPKAKNSPAAKKAVSKKEEKGIVATVTSTLSELWDWGESVGTAIKDKLPTIQIPDGTTTTKVGTVDKVEKKEEERACFCKDYDLIWGNKVSCDFRKKVVEISKDLWKDNYLEMANGLMAVMNVETRGTFKAHQLEGYKILIEPSNMTIANFYKNGDAKTSRAIGLIQFTQDALQSMGEFPASTAQNKGTLERFNDLNTLKLSFARLGEIEQLSKVKKYFFGLNKKPRTPEDIYLAVFAPTGIEKNDRYLLYAKGTTEYLAIESVDINKDGIQRSEILNRYHDSFSQGKINRVGKFNCEVMVPVDKTGEINKYKIEIDKFSYSKILIANDSKKYQYDIYNSGILINTVTLDRNDHDFLPFPQTGGNWGRFGTRDSGGDNWVDEKVCAALLGFFHSLPKNSYSGTLYFNDISANDGRNIGHKGHKLGNDIDIRYPGSQNTAGKILWSEAAEAFNNEADFIKALENILEVSFKWGFNKNYAYKAGIAHTTGLALQIHQDHFHLGLR